MVNTVKFSQFQTADLNSATNKLVGYTSLIGGGLNIQVEVPSKWTTSTRPSSPPDGLLGYNTTFEQYEYWNAISSIWIQLQGGGVGTVTLVNSGTGLTGGPITTTGTLSFAPILAKSFWANLTNELSVPTVTPLSTFLFSANNLSDLQSISTAVSNLGLTIGTNVEAWSHILDEVAINVLPGSVQATVNSFNHGTNASSATFLRGDGLWQAPSGSGSVNPGTINELGYYAASGNAISPLSTIDNGVLVTNGSGQPSISLTLPSNINAPQPNIIGVVDGSNAAPGSVGQFIDSGTQSGSFIVTGIDQNLAIITLTAGDYDIWGYVLVYGGTVNCMNILGGISTVSSTYPGAKMGSYYFSPPSGSFVVSFTPYLRLSLTSTTNVYLVGRASWDSTAPFFNSQLNARRVR